MSRKLDIDALLTRVPLFRNLDAQECSVMATACHQIRVPKHGFAFSRGDACTGLYIVAVGAIKLAIPSKRGHEKVIEFFGPGQPFGEAMMFLGKPYTVEAQALEDSLLIWIDKQDIFAAIDRDPVFARRMLSSLSMRLHVLMQDIESVTLQNASQRVVNYLLSQPRNDGRIRFPFNKNIIASKLGLTPETLSRLLHQLSGDGDISVEGRNVTLLDVDALSSRLLVG
jgi:CRP-like cAMP-binding protein